MHSVTRLRKHARVQPILHHALGPLLTFYLFASTLVIFRGGEMEDMLCTLRSFVLLDAPGTLDFGNSIFWIFPLLVIVHYASYRRVMTRWWRAAPTWVFVAGMAVLVAATLPFIAHDPQPFMYFQF